MNRDDIIRMAREAGMAGMLTDVVTTFQELERFAALVAEHEREHGIKLLLDVLIDAAVKAERQAVLDTVDALMGMERDRNPMFSEGYDHALEHIEQFVKGRK